MKIAADGYKIIVTGFLLVAVSLLITWNYPLPVMKFITVILGIFALFNLYFFRDPERNYSEDPNVVLSPADGKIVLIKEVEEQEFMKGPAIMVSVFLSVFNVHVNRVPVSGKVNYFKYQPGKFLAAFNHNASEQNEQTIIGIDGNNGKVLFKQIAGLIARRVICTLKEGDNAEQGKRMGMIKYGSRVDVYFPVGSKIDVQMGDMVQGGVSVIGRFN